MIKPGYIVGKVVSFFFLTALSLLLGLGINPAY